jgi:hypothetical protein
MKLAVDGRLRNSMAQAAYERAFEKYEAGAVARSVLALIKL